MNRVAAEHRRTRTPESRSAAVDTLAHVVVGAQGGGEASGSQGPAPGRQPLELDIECFNGVSGPGGTKHRVTVHPDWSVTTPHDPEAERIAEAFGSYTSCVTHMERIVAAFRASFGILTRSERVPLGVGRGGSWQMGKGLSIVGCCRGTLFGGVGAAARHTRSPVHLAKQHKVPLKHLEAFLSAAAVTWGSWDGTPQVDHHIEHLVREPGGVGDLWRAGIHPDDIPSLAGVGAVVDEPLPVNFYLGLVYGSADHQWIAEVLAHRPDADTAAWLAWLDQPQTRATPEAWGQWIGFALSRADVLVAIKADLSAEYVHEVAFSNGWPPRAVAAQFVKWADAGCSLKAEHFHALKRHRVYAPRPSTRAIDSLRELVQQNPTLARRATGALPDRTELAVMLEILGNRHEVLTALLQGVRTVDDLDAYVKRAERTMR